MAQTQRVLIPDFTERSSSIFSSNDPCADFSSKFLVCIGEMDPKECNMYKAQYIGCMGHFLDLKKEERKRRYKNYYSVGYSTRTWK